MPRESKRERCPGAFASTQDSWVFRTQFSRLPTARRTSCLFGTFIEEHARHRGNSESLDYSYLGPDELPHMVNSVDGIPLSNCANNGWPVHSSTYAYRLCLAPDRCFAFTERITPLAAGVFLWCWTVSVSLSGGAGGLAGELR